MIWTFVDLIASCMKKVWSKFLIIALPLLLFWFAPIVRAEVLPSLPPAPYISAPVHRIVSLNPTLTEILFALGLGSQVIGVVEYTDFPEATLKIEKVGSYLNPNIEKIISLKPTLVMGLEEGANNYSEMLRRTKVNFESYRLKKIDDFVPLVEKLGALFKKETLASEIKNNWDLGWAEIKQKKLAKPELLIQLDHNPMILAGGDTFLSEALSRCGLKNIFSDRAGYFSANLEAFYQRHLSKILIVGQLSKGNSFESVKKFWNQSKLTKNAQVYYWPADIFSRLGPRLPSETKKLCQLVGED